MLEAIGNFFKRLFAAWGSFFKTLFGGQPDAQAPQTPAAPGSRSAAASQPVETRQPPGPVPENINQEIDAAINGISVSVPVGLHGGDAELTMRRGAYKITGAAADESDRMEARGDSLTREAWERRKADARAFDDSRARAGMIGAEGASEALEAHLRHNPAHQRALDADNNLRTHMDQAHDRLTSGALSEVPLSRQARRAVNDIDPRAIFKQDKDGLLIRMPANSKLEVRSVDADRVSLTVRPIGETKDAYSFAPVVLSISKTVFEQGYTRMDPPERGEAQVYVKKGTFAEGTVLAVMPGNDAIRSKGIDLATAGGGIQNAAATLTDYKPKRRKREVNFAGIGWPGNSDPGHRSGPGDSGSFFAEAVRNDYYRRQYGLYGGNTLGYGGVCGGDYGYYVGPNLIRGPSQAAQAEYLSTHQPSTGLPRGFLTRGPFNRG